MTAQRIRVDDDAANARGAGGARAAVGALGGHVAVTKSARPTFISCLFALSRPRGVADLIPGPARARMNQRSSFIVGEQMCQDNDRSPSAIWWADQAIRGRPPPR